MSAVPSALSEETSRKRMRKGTHSCTECRRRKKSCVMLPNGDKCTECTERGVECLSQESRPLKHPRIESKQGLQERIARLETVVQSVVSRLDTNQHLPSAAAEPVHSETAPSSPTSDDSTQDAGMWILPCSIPVSTDFPTLESPSSFMYQVSPFIILES